MSDILLAQRGLDEMLQVIIVLVIIAGSVLAPLARKMIEKFSGEAPETHRRRRPAESGRPGPARRDVRPPGPTPQPPRPVAQPYPLRPATTAQRHEPSGRPVMPQRRIAQPPQPPARPRAKPRPVTVSRPAPPTRKKAAPPSRPPPRPVRPQKARPRPATPEVEGPFGQLIADWDKEIEAVAERAAQQVEKVGEAYDVPVDDTEYGSIEPRPHPLGKVDQALLRRGVILSELFSPPRGLRPLEDRW